MTIQKLATSLLALLVGAAALAPVATSARSGAFLAGRSAPAPARVMPRTPIVRSSGHAPAPAVRASSLVRPFVGTPQVGSVRAPAIRTQALHQPVRHLRTFGFGFPITVLGGAAYYGRYYDPGDDGAPYYQPAYPNPTIDNPHVIDNVSPGTDHPRQCRAQIQTVPSENGDPREITIVRC
jgi:hypothetical protein